MFNLVSIKLNKTQLRNQINRIKFQAVTDQNIFVGNQNHNKETGKDEEIIKGNIIAALNQAINEFADSGATAVKLNAPINNIENRRLIAVFTNNFDI